LMLFGHPHALSASSCSDALETDQCSCQSSHQGDMNACAEMTDSNERAACELLADGVQTECLTAASVAYSR